MKTTFLIILILLAVLGGSTKLTQPATAQPESFEVVFGQLVFQNNSARTTARAIITNYAARNQYDTPTITDVVAGKYGTGPALLVTMRLDARADADDVWADVTGSTRLAALRPTSQLRQSSVQFDAEEGTQTVTEIHKLTVPSEPDDF